MLNRIKRYALYLGAEQQDFHSVFNKIKESNARSLAVYSQLACVMLLLAIGASFILPSFVDQRPLYLATLIPTLAIAFASILWLRKNAQYSLVLVYLFLASLLTFGIISGTIFNPADKATIFFVFLLALPLLFIDSPIRTALLLVAISVIFLTIDQQVKSEYIFEADLLDCLIFLTTSMACFLHVNVIKVSALTLSEKISVISVTDDLTGLKNRRAFGERMAEVDKNNDRSLTVVSIDVNDLKPINDTLGHEAGDELLKGLADCLTSSFDECYRIGGDEFVLVTDMTKEQLESSLTAMQDCCCNWQGQFVGEISAAVGYCSMSEEGIESMSDALRRADKRMYESKALFHQEANALKKE